MWVSLFCVGEGDSGKRMTYKRDHLVNFRGNPALNKKPRPDQTKLRLILGKFPLVVEKRLLFLKNTNSFLLLEITGCHSE
jgi:hypothetical protein